MVNTRAAKANKPATTPHELRLIPVDNSPYEQEGALPSGWIVRVILQDSAAGPIVRSVELRSPAGAPRMITADAWRKVPIGAVVDAALQNYRDAMDWTRKARAELDQNWVDSWRQLRGREGHPDELYARLAQLYCSLRAAGIRNPVEQLSASMEVGRATASQRLQNARSRGLLDDAELTKKAKKLLGIPAGERGF